MLKNFRRHLSYSNVVSTLCLFLLLGGGAYAASKLPKDSVKSKQIKAGAVRNADLADNAVTSPKVADGSLHGADFAAGQIPQGDRGPAGSTSCPPGTTRLGTTALCYETTVRPAQDPVTAASNCADQSLTLPTLSEVYLVSRATDQGTLWSDIAYYNGTESRGVAGSSTGVGDSTTNTGASTAAFRCVTNASDK